MLEQKTQRFDHSLALQITTCVSNIQDYPNKTVNRRHSKDRVFSFPKTER